MAIYPLSWLKKLFICSASLSFNPSRKLQNTVTTLEHLISPITIIVGEGLAQSLYSVANSWGFEPLLIIAL